MHIPKHVKIGGFRYKVNITDRITLGAGYVGECDFLNLDINIRPGNRARMEQVLLHEVVHAVYEHLGFSNHDEQQIDMFASALHALIINNPDMFRSGEKD